MLLSFQCRRYKYDDEVRLKADMVYNRFKVCKLSFGLVCAWSWEYRETKNLFLHHYCSGDSLWRIFNTVGFLHILVHSTIMICHFCEDHKISRFMVYTKHAWCLLKPGYVIGVDGCRVWYGDSIGEHFLREQNTREREAVANTYQGLVFMHEHPKEIISAIIFPSS